VCSSDLLINAWRNRKVTLVVSTSIVEEVLAVLHRPRIHDRFGITGTRIARLEKLLRQKRVVHWVEPRLGVKVSRDPKDDKFLEAAVAGKAAYLVSGDEDLLVIGKFRDVAIVSPSQMVEILVAKKILSTEWQGYDH
jgi:putative PIN family toxin of toxin-antitoxin system